MTILVAWVGVDSRSIASVYIATDSRISWKPGTNWDGARKIFCFQNYPDIVGYSGDVLFLSQAISEIIDLGDKGVLFGKKDSSQRKYELFKLYLMKLLSEYPTIESGFSRNALSIFYASRTGVNDFNCWVLKWNVDNGWTDSKVEFPEKSGIICQLGDKNALNQFGTMHLKYKESDIRETSRMVFTCFCDYLRKSDQSSVGGSPQLAGLYRNNNAKIFGIIYNKKKTILGITAENLPNHKMIEWRNENFEICDGGTGLIKDGAQRQPNPIK